MKLDLQNAILLVLCLSLFLGVLSLSANAADTFIPLPDDTITLGTIDSYTFTGKATSGDIYVCWCNDSPDWQGPMFLSSSPGSVYVDRNGSSISVNLSYNSTYDLYTVEPQWIHSSSTPNTTLPIYSSKVNAYIAFSDYDPSSPTTSSFQYTLPPGNVAYIPIPSGQSSAITYTLTTTYYMAFGNNDTSRINQVVTVMSALPSTTNNVAPTSPKIPWTNNGNTNLLGVSADKIYQGSISASYGGQYLVVVNPMTMPSQTGLIGGDTYTNGSINIFVSAVSGSPYIYPMSESLTITPGDGIGSESSYGDSGFTYEVDPDTGEIIWTDPDGGSSAPVAGGNNPMPTPNTIFDWLRNISQQLSDFLRGPVQAVQVVVSAIRDFMGSFTQLYQWLPSPVYSLITSALMIALTIGVIKIFV